MRKVITSGYRNIHSLHIHTKLADSVFRLLFPFVGRLLTDFSVAGIYSQTRGYLDNFGRAKSLARFNHLGFATSGAFEKGWNLLRKAESLRFDHVYLWSTLHLERRESLINLDITIEQMDGNIDGYGSMIFANAPNLETLRIGIADSMNQLIEFPSLSTATPLRRLKSLTLENFSVVQGHIAQVASVVDVTVFRMLRFKRCIRSDGEIALETGEYDGIFVEWV
ncbi:hypothetical protein HDU98_009757 [Podochytrium sp. JEL0797]|nr:hypothetical protein HDU98_009757 [Podochytrium sp. JEL0797]